MPAAEQRVDVNHPNYAPENERDLTTKVVVAAETFEKGIGIDFWERCNGFYRLYRGFQKFRNAWEAAGPNDRDGVLLDAKQTWGANLHIPLSFRTIETMVPRAIAHRPKMLYLPRDERWEENVQNVRMLIDSQQDQIDIELEYQDVMRAGMLYGLGVAKVFWRREYASRRRVQRRVYLPNSFRLGAAKRELSFDDPDFENVDIYDFMWDPFATGMRDCGWAIHRSWLSTEMVLDRISSGAWATESAKALDEEKIRGLMGSRAKYDEVHQSRMEASGLRSFNLVTSGEDVHEVLEWHDGEQVLSCLDRQVTVQDGENPVFGRQPFMIYRPTKLPNQMIGIGEIEPVQHLQRELDTLRSQRRDAATLALCAGYAYDDAAIDIEDLVFGPGAAIPVRNARVSDALMPLQRQEVPGSAWQEEQAILSNFDSVTGINDSLAGGDGGSIGTATEAQLVQAALSKRVELKSRRFEVEVVRQSARCFLLLNQRMILKERPSIRQPGEGMTVEEAAEAGRWKWFQIGPGELRGEFEITPEGGSMAAENVPQKRQDAVQIMQMFGQNEYIDPSRPLLKALQLLDIRDPESWLKQPNPTIPRAALDVLAGMGVDTHVIQHAIRIAQARDPTLQGPTADETGQMMGSDQAVDPEAVAA